MIDTILELSPLFAGVIVLCAAPPGFSGLACLAGAFLALHGEICRAHGKRVGRRLAEQAEGKPRT
jgi:hypothetical protein